MKCINLATSVIGGFFLVACGDTATLSTDPAPSPGTTPTATDPTPSPTPTVPMIGNYQAGLQTNGSIGFSLSGDSTTRMELSAPILPRIDVLYGAEGSNFPTTLAGEATLAHTAALTYKWLLTNCVDDYPGIIIPATDDTELTSAQRFSNFNNVANCAYNKYLSKPYWIPQLVNDIDICATELGTDWRLPKETDVTDLSDADIDFINQTLGDANPYTYFSLRFFIRGSDGSLKLGDLSPGVTMRVSDSIPTSVYKGAYVSSIFTSLRCVRRTKLS